MNEDESSPLPVKTSDKLYHELEADLKIVTKNSESEKKLLDRLMLVSNDQRYMQNAIDSIDSDD